MVQATPGHGLGQSKLGHSKWRHPEKPEVITVQGCVVLVAFECKACLSLALVSVHNSGLIFLMLLFEKKITLKNGTVRTITDNDITQGVLGVFLFNVPMALNSL